MGAKASTSGAASRTQFYEQMGVEQSATESDLKKAYRKKALQLHPDKQGGDGEPFKKMKYAYDTLSDPKKRKAYDQYGEAGVKLVEGNVSMEVAMQMFYSIGGLERFLLILVVTLLTGYLLLFPILLSVRWDHPRSMTFAHVFIPVWVGLTFILSFCLCCVHPPAFPDLEEEDEHARKEIEEQQQKQVNDARKLRWGSTVVILVLSVMLTFLVLRLDGEIDHSFFLVIWPWIVLELGAWAHKAYAAESYFLMTGHNPDILLGQKWLTKDWNCFFMAFTHSSLWHIIFACLIALKMDGTKMSWWEVFAPFWVEFVVGVVLSLSNASNIKSEADLAGMSAEARAKERTVGTLMAELVAQVVWTGCVVLLCWKLSHPSAFPAWIIFLPLFVIAGCFCCCLSCFLCCMSPEGMGSGEPDDEEKGSPAAQPAGPVPAPMYGTMK